MTMKRLAVVLADVVEGADVRVIERGRDARLAGEAGERLRIAGELGRQQLQRNLPAKAPIFGAIDDAHAAAAELVRDAVVRERAADHLIGIADYTVRSGGAILDGPSHVEPSRPRRRLPEMS